MADETSGKSTGFFKNLFGKEQSEDVYSGGDGNYNQAIIASDAGFLRQSQDLHVDHTTTYQKYKVYTLYITYVPTGKTTTFKAMLTKFEDAFTSNWKSETVYGRMDDIHTFQNTKRSMTIGFVVPAFDAEDARCNLSKIASLAQYLYPKYTGDPLDVSSISSAPLLRIRFANFISDARTGGPLLGKTNGFSFSPVLEDGFFDYPNLLYPKTINVNLTFDVLHEHMVGWADTEGTGPVFGGGGGFPYTRGGALITEKVAYDQVLSDQRFSQLLSAAKEAGEDMSDAEALAIFNALPPTAATQEDIEADIAKALAGGI